MEDRETARMRKYGESKTTRIMMATVPHVTSGLGLRKFQADGFLLTVTTLFFLFCLVCLATGSQRDLHRGRFSVSSFNFMYPLVSSRSSSSSLKLLPRPPVTSILPCIFPSIMCFKRQSLGKMLPIHP